MKTSSQNWKSIIMTGPDWPADLLIPQTDPIPADSECVLDSMLTNENWEWELWRQPDGHRYFLAVIRNGKEEFAVPRAPGATLTVAEAFQFVMSNWMPAALLADFAGQCPELLKDIAASSSAASRN